jgi:hypothetical protein
LPNGKTVFAPSRPEGTWIEGLLGRTTIFPEEFWFIQRPGMIDRSFKANLLLLGIPFAADNGYIYIRNQTMPGGIHYNPNISVYARGAYANLLTIQDKLIFITIGNTNNKTTISKLKAVNMM